MIDTDKIASEIESCVLMPSETDFLKEHAGKAEYGLIEIGSQYGRSSVILGAVAKKNGLKLVCVDVWEDADVLKEWESNIGKAHVWSYMFPYKALSSDALEMVLKNWGYNKFDFLFIDADHTTEAVRFDYENWSKILHRPATVVFHDVDNRNVRVVFDEACKDNDYDYVTQKNIGAIYLK